MKLLNQTAWRLANLTLFIIILFAITPFVSIHKTDDWLSVMGTALALFTETLLLGLLFFRRHNINKRKLELSWVFITCTTYYFYFINNFLWSAMHLSKLSNANVALFEVFVSITEGLILFFLLQTPLIKGKETKHFSILMCMVYSFLFNTFSTLFGYFASPWVIKLGLNLFTQQ